MEKGLYTGRVQLQQWAKPFNSHLRQKITANPARQAYTWDRSHPKWGHCWVPVTFHFRVQAPRCAACEMPIIPSEVSLSVTYYESICLSVCHSSSCLIINDTYKCKWDIIVTSLIITNNFLPLFQGCTESIRVVSFDRNYHAECYGNDVDLVWR